MREIIPRVLWIGNALEARDVKGVMAAGINVVIDLAIEELPIQFPRDVVYCRFPLLDGEGNSPSLLRSAIQTTVNFATAGRPTLLACSGGMSRSPIIASVVIASVQSVELGAAVERVIATGPSDFSPKLWNDVQKLCKQLQTQPLRRLNLLVIRSLDPKRTVAFYESLGLRFQEEQHGNGPVHWAADIDGLVMEIYPARSANDVNGAARLGFEIDDPETALGILRNAGVEVVSDLTRWGRGLRAVVKDPDGRSVEFV